MKTLLLSHSDAYGGAAKAASRMNAALASSGADSTMRVAFKQSDSRIVAGPRGSLAQCGKLLRSMAGKLAMSLQQPADQVLHSPAALPSGIVGSVNRSSADVVNLHWICDEFLSVRDIARIRKPLVWTLHDMWAFCGAEHYADDDSSARWRSGYDRYNRPRGARGLDVDLWTWRRKRKAWNRPMHIVAPSNWLAQCARQSALMHDWPVKVIPNALDVKVFQPWPKQLARQVLGLPPSAPLVLFGAHGGSRDPRKGWDLLEAALPQLAKRIAGLRCVVFGQSEPIDPPQLGLPIHWLGRLGDDTSLALAYSAADVAVIPSRQDNLPQTGTEAQSCGCPVVAFDCSGLPDVVEHRVTGYLAKPYSSEDLAKGIHWALSDSNRRAGLSAASRARALRLWSPNVVVPQYLQYFREAICLFRPDIQ